MPIVMYLGRSVNEYRENSDGIISQAISEGKILCALCLKQMRRHSTYDREVKETGEVITITVVWCRKCEKWHSLLPDFLLPNKHYSGNEIESVIIDSGEGPLSQPQDFPCRGLSFNYCPGRHVCHCGILPWQPQNYRQPRFRCPHARRPAWCAAD